MWKGMLRYCVKNRTIREEGIEAVDRMEVQEGDIGNGIFRDKVQADKVSKTYVDGTF